MADKLKVVGIHASPRANGATAWVLQRAMELAEETGGVETVFLPLRGRKINHCIQCNRCLAPDCYTCPVYDDGMGEFYEVLPQADVVVLATPVYNMAPTAMAHLFMNRMRPLGKLTSKGEWARKFGVGIAVSGARNGGGETALDVVNRFFLSQGMNLAGAGVYAYNGGTVWSHNQTGEEGGRDETGLRTVAVAVRRAVAAAKVLRAGLAAEAGVSPVQLAGFLDEEDRREYLAAFWGHD